MGAATAKRPGCPGCGNDSGIYVAVDLRWSPELQRWEIDRLSERDSGGPVDCTECDRASEPDEGGFPDPLETLSATGAEAREGGQ